ncbi:hypothetical protein FMUND_4729 [Fusarium mundagurra]|uniref:Uncharacterized protein n=1 Tax=Fusarium mundagurra TaxID=1567541 RepID=A0A8H5YUZ2_9HYPO|nr:hypothetical protein FMUND_4729 [Fusarium mundagurra]
MPRTPITTSTARSRQVHTEDGVVRTEYRVRRPNRRQWVRVPSLAGAAAYAVEWQAVETHHGPVWGAVYQMPPIKARPIPVEQHQEVGTVVDVLSREDETQANIDRGLLPERDQDPNRFLNLLADTHQHCADNTVPGANPWGLHAELEEARQAQSPGTDLSDSSITSLPSSPRQVTVDVDCFPIRELDRNTDT